MIQELNAPIITHNILTSEETSKGFDKPNDIVPDDKNITEENNRSDSQVISEFGLNVSDAELIQLPGGDVAPTPSVTENSYENAELQTSPTS